MFVYCKKNVIFRAPDGTLFRVPAGHIGTVPAWCADLPLFKGLVKDGDIVVTESSKTVEKAVEKASTKKAKK